MSSNPNINRLNTTEIQQHVFDSANDAFRVENISGSLVPAIYDSIALTYIVSGNGAGQIGTVQYYVGGLGGTLVETLTLGYDSQNRLITVQATPEE